LGTGCTFWGLDSATTVHLVIVTTVANGTLRRNRMTNITLDTDELGIWLINETPEGPQQMGMVSWMEVARGVQNALLQEKFLIALAKIR